MSKPVYLDIDAVPTSSNPVELSDLKSHLNVDHSDDDELITGYLLKAIEAAENEMHRSIVQRDHRWALRDFPQTQLQDIRLPRGKTQSVASVKYTRLGVVTTLTGPSSGSPAGTDYQEDLTPASGGVLMPNRGESWPSPDFDVPAPVLITFSAGWADDDIPQDIKHAMMLIVGHSYVNRGDEVLTGAMRVQVPWQANILLSRYSLIRFH